MRLFVMVAWISLATAMLVLPASADEAVQGGEQAQKTGQTVTVKDGGKSKKTDKSVQAYQEHEKQRREAKEKALQMRKSMQEQGK